MDYDLWTLKNNQGKYEIFAYGQFFKCQVGLKGIISSKFKKEGDLSTPQGKWALSSIFYREDRVDLKKMLPNIPIKMNKITRNCGWCDDIKSQFYNKYININNFYSFNVKYEKLWREDNAYDLIITLSHNTKPIIKNKGSAIFIHCSFSDNRNTLGCVALKKKDLVSLLKNLSLKTYLDFSSK